MPTLLIYSMDWERWVGEENFKKRIFSLITADSLSRLLLAKRMGHADTLGHKNRREKAGLLVLLTGFLATFNLPTTIQLIFNRKPCFMAII